MSLNESCAGHSCENCRALLHMHTPPPLVHCLPWGGAGQGGGGYQDVRVWSALSPACGPQSKTVERKHRTPCKTKHTQSHVSTAIHRATTTRGKGTESKDTSQVAMEHHKGSQPSARFTATDTVKCTPWRVCRQERRHIRLSQQAPEHGAQAGAIVAFRHQTVPTKFLQPDKQAKLQIPLCAPIVLPAARFP